MLDARSDALLVASRTGRASEIEDELWREAAGLGWFGIGTDEAHGGLALGIGGLAVLYVELGRCVAPLHASSTLLAAQAIALCGADAQRERWLPALANGECRGALALPLAGQSLPSLGADERVSGQVPHVLGAAQARWLLLPVRRSAQAIDLVLLERGTAGLSYATAGAIDPTRDLGAVQLQQVVCSENERMAVSAAQWNHLLDHASLAMACDCVGGAGRILELTVEYLGLRTQFGRPIGTFQALKHRVATWKVLLESVTALTSSAVAALAAGDEDASVQASSAKLAACDAYVAIAGDAIQLHGGIGFTWEHPCHLYMKRARLNAALYGTSTQHRERVAERAFAATLGADFRRHPLLAS